jgi:DNA-binding SARP family transcriptional activator/tetratricopeptide (TPR) repeat protein
LTPPFTLRTLGVPLLQTATGEAVRFRTRKHFGLAIRLAVESGRPVTRDSLVELLWGDVPDHRGRHSLAQAITVLKTKLGRASVLIHKSTVALAPGTVDVDVSHLDSCETAIAGRFLDGFEIPRARAFEDWRDAWNAKLLPKVRDCLVRQMDAGRRVGDFETVERHARVLGELEPLSEDALRGIMEARAWVGDRTNALKAYADFESRLAVELGARPNADLVRIANLLREGRRSPYRQPSEPAPETGEKRFEPERLIGREKEFGQLYDAWTGVRKRQPTVIMLTGEPGIGKTTLTNAFVSTCQMEGAVVARAQAYDAERELPFAVLAELVKQLTIQRAIGSADSEALSELSRICSDILSAFPGVPKPVEWSAEITPLRLADAFLKTISAAAEDNPLIMVVDDFHAADSASAAILHVVARKLGSARLMLIVTGRNSELPSGRSAAALSTDAMIPRLTVEDLGSLDTESAARLVASIMNPETPLGDSVVQRVLSAAGGNPLILELLAREWSAHGEASLLSALDRLDTLPAPSLRIPTAVNAVFERQIRRLVPTTRIALNFAAILGRRLGNLALYTSVGLNTTAATEALSRLCGESLLREVHGNLEFRNELMRATAYYAVPAVARQHLHRLAARSLLTEGHSDGALQLEVAWHFLRAGAIEDAVAPAIMGANAALDNGAPQEAEQLLRAVLDHSLPAQYVTEARLCWCRALIDQSRAESTIPHLESILQGIGQPTSKQVAEATALRATAEYLVQRETGNGYYAGAQLALTLASKVGKSSLMAQALFEFARSGAELGDQHRVRVAHDQLLELTNDQVRSTRAAAHYALGYCLYFLYDIASAAEHLKAAIEALGNTNPVLLGRVLTGLGNCMHTLCELDGSRSAYERALQIACRLGDDCRASINASNLSALMLLEGDFKAAIHWGIQGVDRGQRALNQPMLQNAYGNLTEAYLLTGQVDHALRSRGQAASWFSRERSWLARVHYLAEEGCHELLMGNRTRALELSTEIERLVGDRGRAVPATSSYEMLKTIGLLERRSRGDALRYAHSVTQRYVNRVPLAYLTAAVTERSLHGNADTAEAERMDEQIQALLRKAPGRLILYRALGLLKNERGVAKPMLAAAETQALELGVRSK